MGLLAVCCGCGIQVGPGVHFPGPTRLPLAATVSGRVHSPRGSGVFGGGHLTLTDPSPSRSFGVRHVIVAGGYRHVSRYGGVEAAAESGLGEPTFGEFDRTGFYGGGSLAWLVRLHGDQDIEPGFAPVAALLDLVATGRGGVWMPPAGSPDVTPQGVGSLHLGLRITALSDLLDVSNPEVEP